MPEPFFGPVTPIWPTIPFPAFGYFQSPMSVGNRGMTLGMPASGVPGEAFGFNSALMPALGGPLAGSVPVIGSHELTPGIMPAAVLAAVAIRRGQPLGPTNDREVEDFIYEVLELLPGASEVEVRCDGGRATLTGAVPQKRVKRDVGEIAGAIPPVNDAQNNVTIAARRRSRAQSRESEPPTVVAGRKQA